MEKTDEDLTALKPMPDILKIKPNIEPSLTEEQKNPLKASPPDDTEELEELDETENIFVKPDLGRQTSVVPVQPKNTKKADGRKKPRSERQLNHVKKMRATRLAAISQKKAEQEKELMRKLQEKHGQPVSKPRSTAVPKSVTFTPSSTLSNEEYLAHFLGNVEKLTTVMDKLNKGRPATTKTSNVEAQRPSGTKTQKVQKQKQKRGVYDEAYEIDYMLGRTTNHNAWNF